MLWITATIFLLAVVLWVIPASRGTPYKSENLELAFKYFLGVDLENAMMQIRMAYKRQPFLQFERRLEPDGRADLVLAFPLAGWASETHKKIEEYGRSARIPHEVRPQGKIGMRFLFLHFGDSAESAAECAQFILDEVFGISPNYKFRVRLDSIKFMDSGPNGD